MIEVVEVVVAIQAEVEEEVVDLPHAMMVVGATMKFAGISKGAIAVAGAAAVSTTARRTSIRDLALDPDLAVEDDDVRSRTTALVT